MLWSGTFGNECQGAKVPAVKARGFIPTPPRRIAELLMDSARVKSYNQMSLGRSDVAVFQAGIDSSTKALGKGETKVVCNRTKPPLTSKVLTFNTLMHARELEGGEYIVVSRAVAPEQEATAKELKSEILLGVNVLVPVDGGCKLTSVTHVDSPLVPSALAKSVGTKGARDFVLSMREMAAKDGGRQ
jgi:hypothetical protein